MLIQWLAQTVAMMLTAFILPGLRITSIFGAFITVVSLAFINSSVWDTALFFNIPLDFTTHTLSILGANAVLFWILVVVLPGIEISGIISAILAPIIFSACTIILTPIFHDVDWDNVYSKAKESVSDVRDSLKEEHGSTAPSP